MSKGKDYQMVAVRPETHDMIKRMAKKERRTIVEWLHHQMVILAKKKLKDE